ncbi:MAG TPA: GspH/FimT family pseudopilin [Candidatus Dormibacteraeota bacterium]|nr:GspH/FimT family pseudopilin [Candidatus Dormibacteraeota bacterium]
MKPVSTRTQDAGHDRGYSLPELLIVIALIGLFVLFGGPAMADAFRAYKVRSVANNVTTDLRALRYNAVSTRTPRTMTINNTVSAPANQYAYTNFKGDPITVLIEPGVSIETTSAASITFNINGSTGATGNQTVSLSMFISGSRNDRYTITITPSGTISSAYSTF